MFNTRFDRPILQCIEEITAGTLSSKLHVHFLERLRNYNNFLQVLRIPTFRNARLRTELEILDGKMTANFDVLLEERREIIAKKYK
jgi:hypothetical protein